MHIMYASEGIEKGILVSVIAKVHHVHVNTDMFICCMYYIMYVCIYTYQCASLCMTVYRHVHILSVLYASLMRCEVAGDLLFVCAWNVCVRACASFVFVSLYAQHV